MKKRRTTFMAVIMTAVMMLATAMPVMATSQDPGSDPGSGTSGSVEAVTSIPLKKKLNVSEGVATPTDIFTFTVTSSNNNTAAPNGAENYTDFSVEPGPNGGLIATSPSIDSTAAVSEGGASATLSIILAEFTKPGIYRYEVTETPGSVIGMDYDDKKYYVDLYIEYNNDILQCSGAWAFTVTQDTGGIDIASAKITSLDFENNFLTVDDEGELHHVDVTKSVAGNQGDKTTDFTFTITYDTSSSGDRVLSYVKKSGGVTTNTTTVASGHIITLKHGETFRLIGLASGDTYKIVETQKEGYTGTLYGNMSVEGYESGNVTADSAKAGYNTVAGFNAGSDVSTNQQTMGTENVEITFTNTKTGNVPTGIFLNYKPFWIMGAVALVLLAVFMGRRKNRYEEEL